METMQTIKRHGNTITLDGTVPEDVLLDMIAQSYQLVFESLTRAVRNAIAP